MVIPYEKERLVAELAIQRAVLLTKAVLSAVDKGTLSKCDDTPVTLADFGAQALIISAIHHKLP
jgi:3'(2'), 5'-bisphosphate nucleotidase